MNLLKRLFIEHKHPSVFVLSKYIKTSLLLLSVAVGLQLSGCSREVIPPKLVYDEGDAANYEVHYEPGLMEQWDDPDVLSEPRIQFTWAPPGEKRISGASIWSMRLDGTDLRQVVSKELFHTPTAGGIKDSNRYSRSPNNRYLAYTMGSKAGYERRLIDLETQTVKVLGVSRSTGDPQFRWFKNNRYLTYLGKGFVQYDIETGELTQIDTKYTKEMTYSFKHYAVDDGNNILVLDQGNIVKFDFETGKLIEKFKGIGRHLTLDEKHWLQHKNGPIYITAFKAPSTKLFSLDKEVSKVLLSGLTGNGPYIGRGGSLMVIKSPKAKHIYYSFPENRILGNISFTNYQTYLDKKTDQE